MLVNTRQLRRIALALALLASSIPTAESKRAEHTGSLESIGYECQVSPCRLTESPFSKDIHLEQEAAPSSLDVQLPGLRLAGTGVTAGNEGESSSSLYCQLFQNAAAATWNSVRPGSEADFHDSLGTFNRVLDGRSFVPWKGIDQTQEPPTIPSISQYQTCLEHNAHPSHSCKSTSQTCTSQTLLRSRTRLEDDRDAKGWTVTNAVFTIVLTIAALVVGIVYGQSSERQNSQNLKLTVWRDCVDLKEFLINSTVCQHLLDQGFDTITSLDKR